MAMWLFEPYHVDKAIVEYIPNSSILQMKVLLVIPLSDLIYVNVQPMEESP